MMLALLLLSIVLVPHCAGLTPLNQLYTDLFSDYNPDVIPMIGNQPLLVTSSFFLTSIRDVNAKSQTITIKGWVKMLWIDEALSWNPALYGNVTVINVDNAKIWTPDVVFFNGVGQVFFEAVDYMKSRVNYNGVVEYEPGGELTLMCPLELRRFPFDTQVCNLHVAPWSYTANQINTVAVFADIATEEFTVNEEWDIMQLALSNSSYESDNGNFTEAGFFFRIRRRPFFQTVTMLVPVILLALLNLFVFRLPAEDGEKINFACGLLLADSMWLIQLIQTLPMNSGSIPLIGVYVIFLMMIASMSIVATVYVIHVHCKPDSEPIPPKLHSLCLRWQSASLKPRCPRSSTPVKQVPSKEHESLSWNTVGRQLDNFFFALCSAAVAGVSLAIGICFVVIKDDDRMPS